MHYCTCMQLIRERGEEEEKGGEKERENFNYVGVCSVNCVHVCIVSLLYTER